MTKSATKQQQQEQLEKESNISALSSARQLVKRIYGADAPGELTLAVFSRMRFDDDGEEIKDETELLEEEMKDSYEECCAIAKKECESTTPSVVFGIFTLFFSSFERDDE